MVLNHGQTLWVTGGRDNTTVNVTPAGSNPGPDLPLAVDGHCLLQINSTTVMMIGGVTVGSYSKQSWILNLESGLWIRGPDMKFRRDKLACGVISDSIDGTPLVIAAGGFSGQFHK